MTQDPQLQQPNDEQRRRNIRRTTVLLVLVALGIYVAFIAQSVLNAQH